MVRYDHLHVAIFVLVEEVADLLFDVITNLTDQVENLSIRIPHSLVMDIAAVCNGFGR